VKTIIDWLAFRTKSSHYAVLEALRPCFGTVGELLELKTGLKGKDGWTHGCEIALPDNILGRIDYGGDSQKEWARVNITGEGCGWVQDWGAVENLDQVLVQAEIKRLDIALTTFKNQVNDALVAAAHEAGKFTCGGRPPVMRSIINSDPTAGRTRYIGKRENHKFLRCYEKGWEMLKDLPENAQFIKKMPGLTLEFDHFGMAAPQDVYRVELELKDVDKFIPFTVIGRRDDVFAGAYPFCAELLPGAEHWVMQELPSFKPRAALLKSLENAFLSYGGIIKAAHLAYGGDDAALLAVARMVMAAEPSRRLVDSGVLSVDHEPVF
jgi:Replication initiation factor